jgi:hypothetical protein
MELHITIDDTVKPKSHIRPAHAGKNIFSPIGIPDCANPVKAGKLCSFSVDYFWGYGILPCFAHVELFIFANFYHYDDINSCQCRHVAFIPCHKVPRRSANNAIFYTATHVHSADYLSRSAIPEKYRVLYSLNPIVGVIEGFRACLLGMPLPWLYIWPGIITGTILLITGALYFRKMERIIVDVI